MDNLEFPKLNLHKLELKTCNKEDIKKEDIKPIKVKFPYEILIPKYKKYHYLPIFRDNRKHVKTLISRGFGFYEYELMWKNFEEE